MDEDPSQRQTEREGFFGAARSVAALTMLSRVMGMARNMAIWAFGATRLTDAFWMAFTIPNLFRRLFGEGALSAAFVPIFTEVAEAEGWTKARLVLANVAGLLATVLATILVVAELVLLGWLVWGRPAADWELLLKLTMIVLPFMFTVCLLALGSAALQCKGRFAYPAFAPILLNLSLIAGACLAGRLFGGGTWRGLFVLAASVIVAGVVQLAGVLWLLRSVRLAALPRLWPMDPAVRRVVRLTLPMMVPLGILQFSAFFDRIYAWVMSATANSPALDIFGWSIAKPLQSGVVTSLSAASLLYQFPLGILAISVATVVFPLFSRYASRGDVEGLQTATNRSLRLSLFMGLPAGVGLMLLSRPAVTLICLHGRFTGADVRQTAPILQMYCLGMWAYFCNHILLRAFFAQKDARTPLRIACLLSVVNMLMVVTLVFTPLRAGAIGLASACIASVNALLLAWVLRRRWGRLGLRQILYSLARTSAASAAMAASVGLSTRYLAPAAVRLASQYLLPLAGRITAPWFMPKVEAGVVVLLGVVAGAAAFVLAVTALRCPEVGELLRRPEKGPAA